MVVVNCWLRLRCFLFPDCFDSFHSHILFQFLLVFLFIVFSEQHFAILKLTLHRTATNYRGFSLLPYPGFCLTWTSLHLRYGTRIRHQSHIRFRLANHGQLVMYGRLLKLTYEVALTIIKLYHLRLLIIGFNVYFRDRLLFIISHNTHWLAF